MHILITGAASRVGRAVAADMGRDHRLRLLDDDVTGLNDDFGADVEVLQGSVLDPDVAWRAVRGVAALIHTGEPPAALPEAGPDRDRILLDLATRGSHVLFAAAVDAGVKRIVYASTLQVFASYPDDVYISENWEPRPTPDIAQMAPYLAERVCTEFARAHHVTVTVLRLGKLVLEEEVAKGIPDLMWLDLRDAARALGWATGRDASTDVWWTRRFALYHVCADIPNPKFLIDRAKQKGFQPGRNFEACWSAYRSAAAGGGV